MDTFELPKAQCPHLNTQSYHREGMSLRTEKEKGWLGGTECVCWVATDQLTEMAIVTLYMKICV